ncbi:MAG TPA: transketolase [Desulfobacterales bacterium]|nr:transketolase [Desulfobacterales bacterium]
MNNGFPQSQAPTDELCINTIRTLSMDAIQKANSGHPGAPMGLAPAAYILWTRFLKHNPGNPDWYDRDRFVLSGGHASMVLYSMLHLTGYDLSLDDIRDFRQWGSKTPGHPEYRVTPGVETTTGPLGQGVANAVGMAMAERHLAARFNRPGHEIVDHHTYMVCGDGDLMEGISAEAASLAGHLGLGKLICIYDDNQITIEGRTDITFTEDVGRRFKAYNWQVVVVEDGNDPDLIYKAIESARAEAEKPSLIMLNTLIAFGSPNKQDSSDAHGAPLGDEEVRLTKKNLGCPEDECFCVPEEGFDTCKKCAETGNTAEALWQKAFDVYHKEHPELAKQFTDTMKGALKEGWDADLPDFSETEGPVATRAASGKILNALAEKIPELMGGSADLAPSNKTIIESSSDFQKDAWNGRNIRFGVREHAMGAILSGMALHGGIRPYGGTFLVFADYMRPSIRLAALMKLPVIYVFTHDSIAVGEDGPTHQPVEHLASLRIIPGLTVIRPADAIETAEAWKIAITASGPVALILSRQKLPLLDRSKSGPQGGPANGAYVLADSNDKPDIILIATGSEVHVALEAGCMLAEKNISARVVSMPSWDLFEKTSQEYKDSVLLPDVSARLAIEAALPLGWERYVGSSDAIIGMTDFGASAPGGVLLEKFGFTPENVVQKAMTLVGGQ